MKYVDLMRAQEYNGIIYGPGHHISVPNGFTVDVSDDSSGPWEPFDSAYTKNESNARYQPIGDYALVSDAWTRSESDDRYALIGDAWTKSEANARFVQLSPTAHGAQSIAGNVTVVAFPDIDGNDNGFIGVNSNTFSNGVILQMFEGEAFVFANQAPLFFASYVPDIADAAIAFSIETDINDLVVLRFAAGIGESVGGGFGSTGVGGGIAEFFGLSGEHGGVTKLIHVNPASGTPTSSPTTGAFLWTDPVTHTWKTRRVGDSGAKTFSFAEEADTRYALIADAYTKSASDARYLRLDKTSTETQYGQGSVIFHADELASFGIEMAADPVVPVNGYSQGGLTARGDDGAGAILFFQTEPTPGNAFAELYAYDAPIFFISQHSIPSKAQIGFGIETPDGDNIAFYVFPGTGDVYPGYAPTEEGVSGVVEFFGKTKETGGVSRILHIGRASGNPVSNPSVGVFMWVDPANDHVKLRKPSGAVIDLG